MEWVDRYIRKWPGLTCKEIYRLICHDRPSAVASLKIDLEEYICARRGELEGYLNGSSDNSKH